MMQIFHQFAPGAAFVGGLFVGLILGLAANLEQIGRIARWRAALSEDIHIQRLTTAWLSQKALAFNCNFPVGTRVCLADPSAPGRAMEATISSPAVVSGAKHVVVTLHGRVCPVDIDRIISAI